MKKEKIDYSRLTIQDIIQRTCYKNISFLELERCDQDEVARFIKTHSIPIKVFGRKWYDIISNRFYVTDFVVDENCNYVDHEERNFDTFGDFFNFVDGDIYYGACFYGYSFTEEQIKKYNLKTDLLNFDAFIDYDIDSFAFETILEKRNAERAERAERTSKILKWVERCKPITSEKELTAKLRQFTSKFEFWGAGDIFFSLMIRKDPDTIKQAVLDHASHNGFLGSVSFSDVLLIYGREAAIFCIDNYETVWSRATKKRHIREFKDQLSGFDSGTYQLNRRSGFSESMHFYYVKDTYSNGINYSLHARHYFGTFQEFASFLKDDLRGSELSEAPLRSEDLADCQIDEATKLPSAVEYESYSLSKYYSDGAFFVEQKWLDKNGNVVLSQKHKFGKFLDFVHFLKGDLSNADLIFCEGAERLASLEGLNLTGLKARSRVAKMLGLPLRRLSKRLLEGKQFELPEKQELATIDTYLTEHPEDDAYTGRVSYISDIHLLHRFDAFKCKTLEDAAYVSISIAKDIAEQATDVNLIGGDTSSDINVFESFISSLSGRAKRGEFFLVLGNHELWPFDGQAFPQIVAKYKETLEQKGRGKMHLVQNNLFYLDREWKEISQEELAVISPKELREKAKRARIVIFGGLGFAGMNDEFNADNGIYRNALNRESEKAESEYFRMLYEKVVSALKGKNLIVFTHMPMRDWGGVDTQPQEGVVYISGHSHHNYFFDDGKKRIYADNQVGYKGKSLSLKQVSVEFSFDWFEDYEDGIYEITREDYESFYRGIGEGMTFGRQFDKLFMIKREGAYMFFLKTLKGNLQILNGGAIKGAGDHSLEYFYENIANYSKSVRMFLSKYFKFQKTVSKAIQKIEGEGTIHGCIVDIDFLNHLYLNPLDGSITPYFAYSTTDKYVYKNLPSLLKYQCPKIYKHYEKFLGKEGASGSLTLFGSNLPIMKTRTHVADTEMYGISRVIKGLQFTIKYNIIRIWNDALVADATEENGRQIVLGIIDPSTMPRQIAEPKMPKVREPKPARVVLTEEEKERIRDEKYKEKVSVETDRKITCSTYRGSVEKADYKCNACGHEWSTRPDHFKDRQRYHCPKCGAGRNE